MATAVSIKPTHKAVLAYYEALKAYEGQNVSHETAVRSAFQNLLAETARSHGWTLIPELTMRVKGRNVRPDGTLRDDQWLFPTGHWEAKDTDDKLDAEIRKKIHLGYPTFNTIFEDTREGVLYQNGREVYRSRLGQPQELVDLLNLFYNHTERDYDGFEQAVAEFKDRIPQLAGGLLEKIHEAHEKNRTFADAFDALLEVCQSSLNPNISRAAVDEMLVQHLLTERLFERVFQNRDFVRRNVIAAEIEKVIDALVSQSFHRHDFLKSLDPFYKAIENTARTIEDFTEKQHFLNTVYERFFQGFSVKVADTHGIVYTPQAIADFMGASVVEVLKTEFGLALGAPGVNVLDPCTGTGNFVVNLLRRVAKRDLPRFYQEQLFANEVMLLPYYVAAQNIEHEYYDLTGQYAPFEGLCFVDTLELVQDQQSEFGFKAAANTARVHRQREAPITVVIGNPPYNVGQVNENDNNKNRKYEVVDRKVAGTYAKDSKAKLKNKLYDPYVKFFRWAVDRLQGRDGIVCFVTNNSFVDQITFDGMRKHLAQDFTRIYHLDLHGNVRQNPKLSGSTHNVFGIQVGVGITVAVKSSKHKDHRIYYHRVPETWRKEQKLAWLAERKSLSGIDWRKLNPDGKHTWLVSENANAFAEMMPTIASNGEAIFLTAAPGLSTNRDEWIYEFSPEALTEKVKLFIKNYNYEVFRIAQEEEQPPDLDIFVNSDRAFLKWTDRLKSSLAAGATLKFEPSRVRRAIFRPFVQRRLYFDSLLVHRRYQQHLFFPNAEPEKENRVITVSQPGYRSLVYSALMTNLLTDRHICATADDHQCFPFYTYDEDGSNRRENITDWALTQFREHYGDDSIGKWDLFHYVYGVLHQPGYREKFADDLKRELPRIPFMKDFRAFAEAGERLAGLHVEYESVEPWPLEWIYAEDEPLSYRVEKMKLSKDRTTLVVNETLKLAGIPPETFDYRLGNRSALDWVIDQYRVSTDRRSGLVTDPNQADDPEAIVRLVEKVVRVSVETVAIVRGLPDE